MARDKVLKTTNREHVLMARQDGTPTGTGAGEGTAAPGAPGSVPTGGERRQALGAEPEPAEEWIPIPGRRGSAGPAGAGGPVGRPGPPGYEPEALEDLNPPPGRRGVAGAQGPSGRRGVEGDDGEVGEEAVGVPGRRGAAGVAGMTGAKGLTGRPGYDGDAGEESYQLPGRRGPTGAAGGGGSVTRAVINAAFPAMREEKVTIVDATVTPTSKINVWTSGLAESVIGSDDLVDLLHLRTIAAAGSFQLEIQTLTPWAGALSVDYTVSA